MTQTAFIKFKFYKKNLINFFEGKKTSKSESSTPSNLPSQSSTIRLSDLFDDDDEDDIFSEEVRLVKKP